MKLKKKEVGIVFGKDGASILVPKLKDDEIVPDYLLVATALVILLKDQDKALYRVINKKIAAFNKIVDEATCADN